MFTTAGKFRLARSTKFGSVTPVVGSALFAAAGFSPPVPKRSTARAGLDRPSVRLAAKAGPHPARRFLTRSPSARPWLLPCLLHEAHAQIEEDLLEQVG